MAISNYMSGIFGNSPVKPMQMHMEKVHDCVSLLVPFFAAVVAEDWKKAGIKQNKISNMLTHLVSLLRSAHNLLTMKMLLRGLILGLIAWLLNGLVFYLILDKVGFPVALPLALTIYAISILAGAASFIPGGIGATETVMALMLLAINSEPHIAIAVPILTRLATLWFAVCVGLLANAYLSINNLSIKQTEN